MTEFYYAIADIHGRYDLLKKTLDHLYETNKDGGKIIFLGDYIDRGPDSDKVCLELMYPPENWEFVCLMGNHEDMLVSSRPREGHAAYQILMNPKKDAIVDWIKNLKLYHIEGDNIFAHAEWAPNITRQDTLWCRLHHREPYHDSTKFFTHGHTPLNQPTIYGGNRLNLDAGAVWNGKLYVAKFKYGKKEPVDIFHV